MRVYAIRKKGTEHYLPARVGRGFTNDEPVPMFRGPRLFFSKASARGALTAWCLGVFSAHRGYSSIDGEYDESVTITPAPHRKKEDMEIVCFYLNEITTDA